MAIKKVEKIAVCDLKITIHEGATNAEVLKALFPDWDYRTEINVLGVTKYSNDGVNITANQYWLESPYRMQEDSK